MTAYISHVAGGSAMEEELCASLTVPGRLDQIPYIRSWLEKTLSRWIISERIRLELAIATTEVCTNIARHGYGGTVHGDIALHLSRQPNVITLLIQDTAPAFEFPPTHDVAVPGALAEGGYGLSLVHMLVDTVAYDRSQAFGNSIRLVKSTVPPWMPTRWRHHRRGILLISLVTCSTILCLWFLFTRKIKHYGYDTRSVRTKLKKKNTV